MEKPQFFEKIVLSLRDELKFEEKKYEEEAVVIEDIEDLDILENEDNAAAVNVATPMDYKVLTQKKASTYSTKCQEEHRGHHLHNCGDIVVLDIEDMDEIQETDLLEDIKTVQNILLKKGNDGGRKLKETKEHSAN